MTRKRNNPDLDQSPPREMESNIIERLLDEDTQHRVDVLGYKMAERVVERSKDPVLEMLWSNLKNPLADFLNRTFGPEPALVQQPLATRKRSHKRRANRAGRARPKRGMQS